LTDITDSVRKFYEKFNNIMAVLSKHPNEISALHLIKTYSLPLRLYGCEVWHLNDSNLHKISVAWNNCFRSVCSCCWRDSAKPLQYFCCTLPISYTNVICCFGKNYCSDNVVLSHCLVLCIMSLSHWVAGMICRCENCRTTRLQDWSGIYLPHLLNC